MSVHPVFLSVVWVVRNHARELAPMIEEISAQVAPLVSVHELTIVDNASDDDSVTVLKQLTGVSGQPNLQVFALTKEVDVDTAVWVGLENALGDFVVVIDPLVDDVTFLPTMLDRAVQGADAVFATNHLRNREGFVYRMAYGAFIGLYKYFSGIDLVAEAPHYRVLSRRVVNFILQHPQPAIGYRHLPATGGFAKANLDYRVKPRFRRDVNLRNAIDRGMRLLVSTTRAPMRMVTTLSLFGAIANVIYSMYVVAIAIFKDDVMEGWVSMSLQQSGMFFLISLVLLVLGEYILTMANHSTEGPPYHVGQEFTSARMTRRELLNVEDGEQGPGVSVNAKP